MELMLYDLVYVDTDEKYLIGTVYDKKLSEFVCDMLNKISFEENSVVVESHGFDDTNRVTKLMKQDEQTGQLVVYQVAE